MSKTKYFMITMNNYDESDYTEFQNVGNLEQVQYMIYQEEIGEKGTPHIQAYIAFKKRKTFQSVKMLFKRSIHIERRKGNHNQAKAYCSKKESRKKNTEFLEFGDDASIPQKRGQRTDLNEIKDELEKANNLEEIEEKYFSSFARYGKYFTDYFDRKKSKKFLKRAKAELQKEKLKEWQKHAVKLILEQDNRKVLWFFDETGNTGKSFLANYMEVMNGAFLIQNAKKTDIAHAYNYEAIVLFDLTRADLEFVNYSTIESFKNGRIFSPKYQSKMKRFPPAKVAVFANAKPNTEKLSLDRFQVIDVERLIRKIQLISGKKI